MNGSELATALGILVVVQVATDFAKEAVRRGVWGGKNGNGNGKTHCPDHHALVQAVKHLELEHQEERRVEVLMKAFKRYRDEGN